MCEVLDAVIVSDIHLGSPCCEADLFLDFLNHLPETTRFIIAGDLLEGESYPLGLRELVIFRQIRKIAKKVETIWIEGNHDVWAREIYESFHNVKVLKDYQFFSGELPVLVTHGDQWDDYLKSHPWQTEIGAYFHNLVGKFSRRLAGWLKQKCKGYTHAVQKVERSALEWGIEFALDKGLSPPLVVCGHTHQPVQHVALASYKLGGSAKYANAGSWTEGVGNYLIIQNGKVELKQWQRKSWSIL